MAFSTGLVTDLAETLSSVSATAEWLTRTAMLSRTSIAAPIVTSPLPPAIRNAAPPLPAIDPPLQRSEPLR